ncbi:hypothetical protein T492DRAFT_1025732 [Pavlovales sp. CCMP2436]|nr:hypothetical protein T492DRAFT_1025732 [Pavlovales sp. CCMP2436]|mmetsp:Transcript_11192/g.29296  ORF Transcript_11192/g.29296 Transcript_11192/m.29296 type:complete len:90 (-) Transcript_11192:415-684(-)
MVCPYRVVTTAFTAVLSILWIHKATAPPAAVGAAKVDGQPTKQAQPRKWTVGTVLLLSALILLHIDLLVTGHLRAATKGLIAQLRAGRA